MTQSSDTQQKSEPVDAQFDTDRPHPGRWTITMKPWKVVLLILLVLAVAAVGYGATLVRRGFSALATPSAVEEFAATTARKMAVPSSYRELRNPITPSTEKHSERHGTFC